MSKHIVVTVRRPFWQPLEFAIRLGRRLLLAAMMLQGQGQGQGLQLPVPQSHLSLLPRERARILLAEQKVAE